MHSTRNEINAAASSPLRAQAFPFLSATESTSISLQTLAEHTGAETPISRSDNPSSPNPISDEEAGRAPFPEPFWPRFSQFYISGERLAESMKEVLQDHAFQRLQAIIIHNWRERGIGACRALVLGCRATINRGKRLGIAATKRAKEGKYAEKIVHFSTLFSSFAVIATSKMAEEERDEGGKGMRIWEVTFMLFYILWGFSVMISLYFDWLQTLSKVFNTVSHIGCCCIILYFFASILSIKTPTTVLPICINLGLLASLGVQRISPVQDRIFTWIGTCLGMPYQPGGDNDDV